MAYALGVASTRLADAYNIANTTPNIVYELVLGGVLASVLVPVLMGTLTSNGRDETWNAARAAMTLTFLISGLIAIVVIVIAPAAIELYTFGATGPEIAAERALATFLLRWFMPQVTLYAIGAVITALLNVHRRFAAPVFAPVLNNLIAVGTFVIFAALPGPTRPGAGDITQAQRLVLALGTTLGVLVMTAALWPSIRRLGFRFQWRLGMRHPAIRQVTRLAGWTLLYVGVNQLGLLVVIVLAARVGGYTAYTAAFILYQLPFAIFVVSVMTAVLPELSAAWAVGDMGRFRTLLSSSLRTVAFVILPAAAGYVALAVPIARLLFEHGAATPTDAALVGAVLTYFAIGLLSFCWFLLMQQAFHAMKDTRTPALINVVAVAVNTVANLVLIRFFGVKGLALGHAIAYTFAASASALVLRRRRSGPGLRFFLWSLARVLPGALGGAGIAWVVAGLLDRPTGSVVSEALQVAASVGAGVAGFLAWAFGANLPELQLVARIARSVMPSRSR